VGEKLSEDEKTHKRTRTMTWEDPLPALMRAREMSGLEYLRAIQDGRIPMSPIGALVDMRLVEVSDGRAVFELKPAEFHYNPIGSVHGGIAATLLDSAMGCAINTMLPRGVSYTTLELKVNYVRPMTRDTGMVRAEGGVIHLGGRIALAEGRLVDAAGKLYAHATTTCLVIRG